MDVIINSECSVFIGEKTNNYKETELLNFIIILFVRKETLYEFLLDLWDANILRL